MAKETMYLLNDNEETIKTKVRDEYFNKFQYEALGKIDFAIYEEIGGEKYYHLWAEAKRGNTHSIEESFVQLILTIGKSPYTQSVMPPFLLGAFDAERIAFIEYSEFLGVFRQNDFNWNVAPSDHTTKEFLQLYGMVEKILATKTCVFSYAENDKELREFIKTNFVSGKIGINKIQIHKHNFIHIYYEWCRQVRDRIKNVDWELFNRHGIISADFFLADLMCDEGKTIFDKLRVLWEDNRYKLKHKIIVGEGFIREALEEIYVDMEAHEGFWFKYERPPMEEYREFMLDRRDLLVPVDIRERKGSYYTPKQWVKLSQEYLANTLGDDWQDKYYVWDCCAGTGNLLRGLNGGARIFASTLGQEDVDVMLETIAGKILPEGNIFQFDFLNDDLNSAKVPKSLRDILQDEEKRKRLIIYINPPYAEAGNVDTIIGKGTHKTDVAVQTKTYQDYLPETGLAGRELFAQFFIRIYKEINGCILAEYSKLKHLQASNFNKFREVFQPKLKSLFLVPAITFDNVTGQFPIGFFIWDTSIVEPFESIEADVYDLGGYCSKKTIRKTEMSSRINDWLLKYKDKKNNHIGFLSYGRNDFQHQKNIYILNDRKQMPVPRGVEITENNIMVIIIYVAVGQVIEANWINDCDQFLYPNDGWKGDKEFQSNCLAYTLFHGQNRISSAEGVNHWIPFDEMEVGAKTLYESHFMIDFIKGKIGGKKEATLLDEGVETGHAPSLQGEPIVFSEKARAMMDAGRELWRYYHAQKDANPNASYYDIKRYFQGYDEAKKKMNARSGDARYEELHDGLKVAMRELGKEIEGKVWEYGFLR